MFAVAGLVGVVATIVVADAVRGAVPPAAAAAGPVASRVPVAIPVPVAVDPPDVAPPEPREEVQTRAIS